MSLPLPCRKGSQKRETLLAAIGNQLRRVLRWLHKVYTEIEERFIRQADDKRFSPAGRRV
jgi:hypothetical protein